MPLLQLKESDRTEHEHTQRMLKEQCENLVKTPKCIEEAHRDVTMKPEVVDPDDIEMLQDLVISAVNEALRKVDDAQSSQMSKMTGGMNIPGLF